MSLGRGVMAVWNDLVLGHDAEFDTWYTRQHIPERLSQPGFREARRYVAQMGSPRYCAFYWLDNVAALKTPQYLARLAQPTRWTQRMMPRFLNMARSPCTVTLDQGYGIGGSMLWIAGFGSESPAIAPRAEFERAFASYCDDPAIVRMQLWECDFALAQTANPEARLRTAPDTVADWIVCVEGRECSTLGASAERLRTIAEESDPTARLRLSPCYRLTWQISAGASPRPCSDEDAGVT